MSLQKKHLPQVPPDRYFWVNNGPVVKDLRELCAAISDMPLASFRYHANEEKNDFATWIRDIFSDEDLAEALLECETRAEMVRSIKASMKRYY